MTMTMTTSYRCYWFIVSSLLRYCSITALALTTRPIAMESPILRLGLLADIQYADIPDGHSVSGNLRYYRNALKVARVAAKHFEESKVDALINLGDIVDGKAAESSPSSGTSAVSKVITALSSHYTSGPIWHAYGNHCLYNMDRETMQHKLGIQFVQEPCGDMVGYYSKQMAEGMFRFLFLDSYDVAIHQRCVVSSKKRKKAVELLKNNNHNYHRNVNSPEGLVGLQRRFVGFNGAVGEIQLQWLESELVSAREKAQKVIIFSHQPISPQSTNPICLMWNYEDVLRILRAHSDVVVASFAGHSHHYGYERDAASGIHFRVLEAVLENTEPTYSFLDGYHDRLVLRGIGNCVSEVYTFDHCRQQR
jgi:manganese-dependent ADP-ribose/CDP-alcohol diphosphatase